MSDAFINPPDAARCVAQYARASAGRSLPRHETQKQSPATGPAPESGAIHSVVSLANRSGVAPQAPPVLSAHPRCSCGNRKHLLEARGFFPVLDFVGEGPQHQRFNLRNGFDLRHAIRHRTGKRRHFRDPSAILFSFDFDSHATTVSRAADPASASLTDVRDEMTWAERVARQAPLPTAAGLAQGLPVWLCQRRPVRLRTRLARLGRVRRAQARWPRVWRSRPPKKTRLCCPRRYDVTPSPAAWPQERAKIIRPAGGNPPGAYRRRERRIRRPVFCDGPRRGIGA